ncbi:MAG: efflux RND transporter periplasmic adaptor subunit [Planctomycetota bacterium]|jgi:RND family efflux transporter MFP subunit
MKRILKIALPLLIVAGAGIVAVAIIRAKPKVETRRPVVPPPIVRVERVEIGSHQFFVKSQGTVSPRTESRLVPEVSGRVIWVAPSFVSGGFFEADEVLLKIDPQDHERAFTRAQSDVAQRDLGVAQEEAEARLAEREWKELGEGAEADPLTLRVPQLNEAKAQLASARAALEQARRDLERTKVQAPYAGRVREKLVDLGQYVNQGTAVATLYSVDLAEIRLPLPNEDLAYIDLPLVYRGDEADGAGTRVILRADFAGKEHSWEGRIVRTEGEIDRASRMVHVVAQVKNPYGRSEDLGKPPLAVGMYVRAEIEGYQVDDVAVLPRASLRGKSRVWIVDSEDRLRFREVELARATREHIIIRSGLEAGERVCLTSLEAVTDGMRVRTVDESKAATAGGTTRPADEAAKGGNP